ncbi:DNA methyltransferase [Streptomyces sp. NPDC005407]|uniref:DNA methyltransferase n=1 Tax=Streptomyces sp. NPDC005407 TaxID=3155340 RepID=UPI0033AE3491
MDPYYADDGVTLYLDEDAGCLAVLPTLPDASVDAIVTDPPYNLSDSRKRDANCMRRIIAEFLLPHLDNRDAQIGKSGELSGPSLGGSLLGEEHGAVRVDAGIGMPEGPVHLQGPAVGEHEVDTGNEAPSQTADNDLPAVADAESVQLLGDYVLQLADGGDAPFCDGTCSCFAEPSPGLIAVTVALPGSTGSDLARSLLSGHGRGDQDVRLLDDAECEAKSAPAVVAGAGAVVRAVLRLDLARRTGQLLLADGAGNGRPLFFLTPAQPVGAAAGAGGLTAVTEPGLISLVGDPTDRALSLHFPWHAVNSSRQGKGFMGKEWDGWESPAAYQRWCLAWASQCWRVLKPGGHLLAFGGTRTYHRMTVAIEDAGFEIRDSLHWIYGSGFPKGQDIARSIDRRRNDRAETLQVTAWLAAQTQAAGWDRARLNALFGFHERGMATHWITQGVAARVPNPEQWERLQESIGFDDTEIRPLVAELNARRGALGDAWGQREVVGQGFRVRRESVVQVAGISDGAYDLTAPASGAARQWQGWNTALKPAHEPIVLARKSTGFNTTVANVLEHGTGALNIDGCRTQAGQDYRDKCASVVGIASPRNGDTLGDWTGTREDSAHDAGRWPTNILLGHGPDCVDGGECQPGCPVTEMDAQSGITGSNARVNKGQRHGALYNNPSGPGGSRGHADTGGASRFFPIFRYEAKAPASERPRLPDGTAHTTVKPLALMRWLLRLVTPPGGTVLDPFAGSGTTLEACTIEGFPAIGIERERPHAELCRTRLTKPIAAVLFGDDPAA